MTQTLSQLENRDAFIERHIGSDAQQQQEMLKTVGADSLNAPDRPDCAAGYPAGDPTTGGRRDYRIRRAGGAEGDRRSQQALQVLHRHGLHRRATAAGHSAQHAGKPGLVHRLYPLPTGSIPWAVWNRCSTSSRSLWI